MLQKLKERRGQDGFTIIEVLIVLAIAGLIMLVVFLAVPALQRNSRNTQRNNDVSALIGALNEYVNNSGGQIPASCSMTSCAFVDNAKLGFYESATDSALTFTKRTTAGVIAAPTGQDTSVINAGSFSTCNSTGTASTATGATARSVAFVYYVETGGDDPQLQCKTAQ